MERHVRRALSAGGAAVALIALACESPDTTATRAIGAPSFWVGCTGGLRFTGGGRVDPEGVGKVTFGFNVDGRDLCGANGAIKGQVQVVEHETTVIMHSTSLTSFASFTSPSGGQCGEWDGSLRLKEVKAGGDWTTHHFFMQVCDNGEPGHGVDTFSIYIEDPGPDGQFNNVSPITLTGGNIQAHKS